MNSLEFDLAPNLTGDDELWTDAEKHNDAICVFIDGVYGHICRFSVQAHSVTFAGNCIWLLHHLKRYRRKRRLRMAFIRRSQAVMYVMSPLSVISGRTEASVLC